MGCRTCADLRSDMRAAIKAADPAAVASVAAQAIAYATRPVRPPPVMQNLRRR